MNDEVDCYVLLYIEAPFGTMQQVSGLMRASEAAMAAASYMPMLGPDRARKGGNRLFLKSVRVVQLKKETR